MGEENPHVVKGAEAYKQGLGISDNPYVYNTSIYDNARLWFIGYLLAKYDTQPGQNPAVRLLADAAVLLASTHPDESDRVIALIIDFANPIKG